MPLSQEFQSFYQSWVEKADQYSTETVNECFDKYFTLFVIYNRLYAEATFVLGRKNQVNLANKTAFPDSQAARSYVLQYVGSNHLLNGLEGDETINDAIETIKNLINNENFYIKLNMVTGDRQRDKDLDLLKRLRSKSSNRRAEAILETLYCIRCNMFHGHKGFQGVQADLLRPAIEIIKNVSEILFAKLKADQS
jgi:hypothetical protein